MSNIPFINVSEIKAEKIESIYKLKDELEAYKKTKRYFQRLPFKYRRRVQSHNPYRIPRLYRSALEKDKINNKDSSIINKRKTKRKKRLFALNYTNNSTNGKWLSTHLWHAKRSHIGTFYSLTDNINKKKSTKYDQANCIYVNRECLWVIRALFEQQSVNEYIDKFCNYLPTSGYKLPICPTQKCRRSQLRNLNKSCIVSDISYYICIIIPNCNDLNKLPFSVSFGYSIIEFEMENFAIIVSKESAIIQIHPLLSIKLVYLLNKSNVTYTVKNTYALDLLGPLSMYYIKVILFLYKARTQHLLEIQSYDVINNLEKLSILFDNKAVTSSKIIGQNKNKYICLAARAIPRMLGPFNPGIIKPKFKYDLSDKKLTEISFPQCSINKFINNYDLFNNCSKTSLSVKVEDIGTSTTYSGKNYAYANESKKNTKITNELIDSNVIVACNIINQCIPSIRLIYNDNHSYKTTYELLNRLGVQFIGIEDKIRIYVTFGIPHFPEHFSNYSSLFKNNVKTLRHKKEQKLRYFNRTIYNESIASVFDNFTSKNSHFIVLDATEIKFIFYIGQLLYSTTINNCDDILNSHDDKYLAEIEPIGYVIDSIHSLKTGHMRAICRISNIYTNDNVILYEVNKKIFVKFLLNVVQ